MRQRHGPRELGAVTAIVAGCLAFTLAAPPMASATVSREEYVQQADPICQVSNQALTRLWKRFLNADKHGKFHAAGNALAGIGNNLVSSDNKLRLIAPPPGDEARLADWLHTWDRIAEDYAQMASAYRLGEYKRFFNLLRRSAQLQRSANSSVSDFPFQVCG